MMDHTHADTHDARHQHEQGPNDPPGEPHAHRHVHSAIRHRHAHVPDMHHTHRHRRLTRINADHASNGHAGADFGGAMPFTIDQFFAVFGAYNKAIWPAHILAYAIGIGALWSVIAGKEWSGRAIFSLLGIYWIWNGVAYHYLFFAPINPAAYAFAALFVLQGMLFLVYGLRHAPQIRLELSSVRGAFSAVLIAYAMVVYSALGYLAGHGWPNAPVFGVAPCPTTIFTLAILIAAERVPMFVAVVPVVWALIGTSAAVLLGVPEDLGLLVAAVAVVGMPFRARALST